MANFPTHIAVGTVVSGALATVTVAADMVAPENIVAVTLAGVLGSVLPDIDLEDSRPGRAMFAGLGVFFSFAVLFSLERKYSIAEMLVLWLGTLLFVRYVAKEIFFRISYHRGVWHSILAMVFCSFVTAWVYSKLLGKDEGVAWLAAGFLAIGFLTHLILDELYSVDVMDTRIKASFGTALKLYRSPAARSIRSDGHRHGAGVRIYAADQDVCRQHHVAPALDRAQQSPAASGQVVWRHGVDDRRVAACQSGRCHAGRCQSDRNRLDRAGGDTERPLGLVTLHVSCGDRPQPRRRKTYQSIVRMSSSHRVGPNCIWSVQ